MAWPTKEEKAAKAAQMVTELPELPIDKIDQLLALMQGVRDEVSTLGDRVVRLEGVQPRFVPMKPVMEPRRRSYEPPEALRAKAMRSLQREGAATAGGVGLLDDPGEVAKLPPDYRPVFQAGDPVQLNPLALVHGGEDKEGNPRTWAALVEEVRTAKHLQVDVGHIVGEVRSVIKLGRTFEPKYRVAFPGWTQDAVRGDGFWESELLPYE